VKRVLLAEDDPDTAAAIKATLEERLSITVDHVTNGALVLDQAMTTRPDLLILDISMPGLSGIDVFDLVRGNELWDTVPILFLTAAPDKAERAFAPDGIRVVMAKPFDSEALVARVSDLLGRDVKAA
jgi:DNA-binding response OmpR family regulator